MAEKQEKKRKRQADGAGSLAKKVAREAPSVNPPNTSNGLHPVLVSAPGLSTPAISFIPYATPLSKRSQGLPSPSTHDLLLHSSEHPRLDYTASPIALDQNLSHYVAVVDASTKQLHVTPAYHLCLRGALRREPLGSEEERPRRTNAQQREDLGREFGTKKAKKAIADKTFNAIVRDGDSKDQLGAVQLAILDSMADYRPGGEVNAETRLASKPIPTPNLDAESLEEVYSFDTLIPQSDSRLVSVKDWQENARAETTMQFKHRFPANRVQAVGTSDDLLRLKALRYLNLLLEFHDALQNAGKSGKKVPKREVLKTKLSAWPDALVDSVRRRFTNAQNELPKWNMDKLYTHMCALSLYVDGWTTVMTDLKDDLKMENKRIAQFFYELGCRVGAATEKEREAAGLSKKQAAATRVAKLRLPLEFPKPRSGRRR